MSIVLALLLSSSAHATERYTIVPTGQIGGAYSSAVEVDGGYVVGTAEDGTSAWDRPFLSQYGAATDLGAWQPNAHSIGTGVNAAGEVCGHSAVSVVSPLRRAFTWNGAGLVELLPVDDLPILSSQAADINSGT
jgi:hypothetical protein